MENNTPFFCCRMLRFISNNTAFVLYPPSLSVSFLATLGLAKPLAVFGSEGIDYW